MRCGVSLLVVRMMLHVVVVWRVKAIFARLATTNSLLPQTFMRCTALRLREPTTGPPLAACCACRSATAARSACCRPRARPPA
jgi:hypothetical protein